MQIDNHFALFDTDDGGLVVLSDFRRTICFDARSTDPAELAACFAEIESAALRGEWFALVEDYGLGAGLESAINSDKDDRSQLQAWAFDQAHRLDASEAQVFIADRVAGLDAQIRAAGIADVQVALRPDDYGRKVEQIRDWIIAGDCYQINLTFPIDFQIYGDPFALYAGLRERQPVRYGAFIATPEQTLLSFSPELFFERQGSWVVTRPMKGTAPRGVTSEDDRVQRETLLASEKERAENIMIVDLLRNDLGRLAQPGKVRVEALCEAEAYPSLWQMVSTISADLPGVGLNELFRALFPCGSITGAPKIAAMQKIAQLETASRGAYTGTLGWVAPGGDCRFNVAIRTIEVSANGKARLGVGSGIVIDADPAREYAECLLKARFLTGYDPGFELIETMRLEAGAYRFLDLHLDRLQASAVALGFTCRRDAIAAALAEYASSLAPGCHRVRLTLVHDGHWTLSSAALIAEAQLPRYAVIADERLDADDYLLRHKTSARSRYDAALATLRDHPEVFDLIFLNTRGEVCEGARSSVFVERDGRLLTPPLACGLLPGVMRRYLLESGRAVECVLHRDDLLGAAPVYLANALRGLIPVTVRG